MSTIAKLHRSHSIEALTVIPKSHPLADFLAVDKEFLKDPLNKGANVITNNFIEWLNLNSRYGAINIGAFDSYDGEIPEGELLNRISILSKRKDIDKDNIKLLHEAHKDAKSHNNGVELTKVMQTLDRVNQGISEIKQVNAEIKQGVEEIGQKAKEHTNKIDELERRVDETERKFVEAIDKTTFPGFAKTAGKILDLVGAFLFCDMFFLGLNAYAYATYRAQCYFNPALRSETKLNELIASVERSWGAFYQQCQQDGLNLIALRVGLITAIFLSWKGLLAGGACAYLIGRGIRHYVGV